MQEKTTDELNGLLEQTHPDQLNTYLKENRFSWADEKKGFYYFMKEILQEKKIRLKNIYALVGVDESWGGKIITMEKHTKNRDLIIMFCIGGHFSLQETNRALKLYGMRELYAKDSRDACLIVAINNRIYRLRDIDDLLEKNGFKILSATHTG